MIIEFKCRIFQNADVKKFAVSQHPRCNKNVIIFLVHIMNILVFVKNVGNKMSRFNGGALMRFSQLNGLPIDNRKSSSGLFFSGTDWLNLSSQYNAE